jgi:hypothetical protein
MEAGQVVCDGQDPDHTYFRVGSYSRDLEHTVSIDNRTGFLTCSCEDSTCRRKHAFLMDRRMIGACLHQKAVLRILRLAGVFGGEDES